MMDTFYMPALQGQLGTWTYYNALMPIGEICRRVGYARDLYTNPKLSELIQRRLDDEDRARDIAEYLVKTKDRFFGSLVVGVYAGDPQWFPFNLRPQTEEHELGNVVERDQDLVGYLALRGDERLFALDGQHRLAGMKIAVEEEAALSSERVSVIFVSHAPDGQGLQRTRGLFISLNKRAVPVKKRDIIVLDEIDLAAIITRNLVDSHPWFARDQIDLESSQLTFRQIRHAGQQLEIYTIYRRWLFIKYLEENLPLR